MEGGEEEVKLPMCLFISSVPAGAPRDRDDPVFFDDESNRVKPCWRVEVLLRSDDGILASALLLRPLQKCVARRASTDNAVEEEQHGRPRNNTPSRECITFKECRVVLKRETSSSSRDAG